MNILNLTKNQFRLISILPILFCAALLGYALYVEYVDFLSPCPLCILQRVVFVLIAVIYFIASLYFLISFSAVNTWVRKVFGVIISLVSIGGIAISSRHIWLQNLPADEVPDCGPGLYYMLESSPFFDAISSVFKGSGSCAEIKWDLFGLSMPTWTLFCYIGLLIFTILWMKIKIKS